MPSMSQISRPAFERGLTALSGILRKAQDHAETTSVDETVLLQARLYPDMFPLVRQVQSASDSAKGAVARLSGTDNPSFPDTEASFVALQDRIERTLTFVRSVPPEAIDGSERRIVEVRARQVLQFEGQHYLFGFALPNFYFHVTTAYDILRHNGVKVGKLDYLGQLPLLSVS